jgi:anti-sigma factor RsiW
MHTLVGAYVMDAVPDSDRADFERHLVSCEQCRDDVRGLRAATARLASAAAVTPRPELREQTLQAAMRIRQLPPLIPAGKPRGIERRSGRAAGHWLAGRGRRFAGARGAAGTRPWLARAVAGLAVVLAVTAIVFGVHLSSMQGRLTAAQQRDHAIAAVLSAHDAVTMKAPVSTGGMATVVMSHRADALVFIASGLTGLPASKSYELWLMSPSGATPAGMLPAGHHGMSGPMVVDKLKPGDKLGVTVEPAAGASRPTTRAILLVGLGS